MQSITLGVLQSCLDQLNDNYPRPGIPRLSLSEPCDITNPSLSWPNAGSPGVYALMNEQQKVLYIGKASCSTTLGYRLGAHFYANGKAKKEYFNAIRYVATISLPKDRAFEAPAIEEFLISKLNPSLCTIARSEPLPLQDSVPEALKGESG